MASPQRPPPPNGRVLSLISALSNAQNHDLHLQAIRARDEALAASPDSYGNLCLQLAYVLVGSDSPADMVGRIDPAELEAWRQTDQASVSRLQQDPTLWVPFGQMAGLILKSALLRPPPILNGGNAGNGNNGNNRAFFCVQSPAADHLRETLLFALGCRRGELRAVASSIVAAVSVSADGGLLQPALHVRGGWNRLVRCLIDNLQQQQQQQQQQQGVDNNNAALIEGSLLTVRKIMEDGPRQLDGEELDALVPVLIGFLSSNNERCKVAALQSVVAFLSHGLMPSALVLHFNEYLAALSHLASAADQTPAVHKLVCRSIVTLLELRTEYVRPHLKNVCQFMLLSTMGGGDGGGVALEACEFWLAFAHLDDEACPSDMVDNVMAVLPQLIPVLLRCMVYLPDQRAEILARNDLDREQQQQQEDRHGMKPVFHRSRAKHSSTTATHTTTSGNSAGADDDGYQEDDVGDNDSCGDWDDDDDNGNEWTLRKCAAASLDSLANLYGAEIILPCLLPALEEGLGDAGDPWRQEASILALGAIAEGCCLEMSAYLGQLHPYLMNHLATPEGPNALPQIKCICAWTIGRYAAWAVEQVQTGAQGHLLAQMTEVFMTRLGDSNRRVQVACCSGFGVVVEVAGDLMAPYLEPVYKTLVSAVSRYQGRSLLMVFDVLGIMADCCGPAIAEGELPSIYVPPLLRMWDGLAKNDPTDRTLLPLMESLASIAMTSGMNFQPYSLETFENAMCTIESVTLLLTTSGEKLENEEDVDPIICAADLLDGLAEGLGSNFQALVSSSQRYGQHFLNVLLSLCQHDIAGVRMSGLALLGDLARNAPGMLEPALPQLLQEAIANMDPVQPSVSTNAVWAIGEICVRCEGNDAPLKPFAPALMQNLIALLMGNGLPGGDGGRGVGIPGLAENAAACVGRIAKANPEFVAPELPRFLLGWCDGMAKISDPTERRDAFQGFIATVYANPQAIQRAAAANSVADAIASIVFAVLTWHIPPELPDAGVSTALLNGEYNFRPFPQQEQELGAALVRLVRDMKVSVGVDTWNNVEMGFPVNVRRLLREVYF